MSPLLAGACAPGPRLRDVPLVTRPIRASSWYGCRNIVDGPLPAIDVRRVEDACALERETANKRAVARGGRTVQEECACTRLGAALMWQGPAGRRRGIETTLSACEDGALDACDSVELTRSLCLQQPEAPECEVLRDARLIPRQALPLAAILGCHARSDQVLCLSPDELDLRGSDGAWVIFAIRGWRREDATHQPRWVADVAGGRLLIAQGNILESPCADDPERNAPAWIDPSTVGSCQTELVSHGPLIPLAEREREDVRRAIGELGPKLRACDATVRACWRAAEDRIVPPGERYDMPDVIEAPGSSRSLRACHAEGARVIATLRARVSGQLPEPCQKLTTVPPP